MRLLDCASGVCVSKEVYILCIVCICDLDTKYTGENWNCVTPSACSACMYCRYISYNNCVTTVNCTSRH